jgi:hypothetical protein
VLGNYWARGYRRRKAAKEDQDEGEDDDGLGDDLGEDDDDLDLDDTEDESKGDEASIATKDVEPKAKKKEAEQEPPRKKQRKALRSLAEVHKLPMKARKSAIRNNEDAAIGMTPQTALVREYGVEALGVLSRKLLKQTETLPRNTPRLARNLFLLPLAFCHLASLWLQLPYTSADFSKWAMSGVLPTLSVYALLPLSSAYRHYFRPRGSITRIAITKMTAAVSRELALVQPSPNSGFILGHLVRGLRLPEIVAERARGLWKLLPFLSMPSELVLVAAVVVAMKLTFAGWNGDSQPDAEFLHLWVEAWSRYWPETTPWLDLEGSEICTELCTEAGQSRFIAFCRDHLFADIPANRPQLVTMSSLVRGVRESFDDPAAIEPDPFILAERAAAEESARPMQESIFHAPLWRRGGSLARFSGILHRLCGFDDDQARFPAGCDIAVPRIYEAVMTICASFVDVPVQRLHMAVGAIELCLTAVVSYDNKAARTDLMDRPRWQPLLQRGLPTRMPPQIIIDKKQTAKRLLASRAMGVLIERFIKLRTSRYSREV